jgi:hypothetical protein
LSGFKEALILVDGKKTAVSEENSITLPAQKPGKHIASVKIFDSAGNSVEDSVEFEILPLPMPVIGFLTDTISQGSTIFVSGKSVPNSFVDINVYDENDIIVFTESVIANESGNWEIIIEKLLLRGKYDLTATTRDERGAVSYPTERHRFAVKAKIVLSIGAIDFSLTEVFILAIFIFIIVGVIAGSKYLSEERKKEAYKIIANRDMKKFCDLLDKGLKELSDICSTQEHLSESDKTTINFRIEEIKSVIERMRKYLVSGAKK